LKKVKDYDFEGGVYTGEIKADIPHGWGKLTWPDGKIYAGHFIEGEAYGQGTLTWADGRVETGGWEKGEFVGDTDIEYKEISGIRANGILLEIICWLVVSLVLMIFNIGFIVIILSITIISIGLTPLFAEENPDIVRVYVLWAGSLFTLPLIVIIGDLFRFYVVRRFYTGHKPLKYGILKNIETYCVFETYYNGRDEQ
jgi:hypothetical protein